MNDTNVAAILHNIAADSDKPVGKILKAAEKVAQRGECHIAVDISADDFDYLYHRHSANERRITPLVEKLESLGFEFCSYWEWTKFFGTKAYRAKIRW